MKYLERILDKHTMYQILTVVLGTYVAGAMALSMFGAIRYSLLDLGLSLIVIMMATVISHYLLVKMTNAPANMWSSVITALILFLIFTPTSDVGGLLALAVVAFIAVVSKYVVRYRNVHLFNPVAFAAVLAGLFGLGYASWWVGSLFLAPLVIVGGLVVSYKIRRLPMVLVGIVASIVMVGLYSILRGNIGFDVFHNLLLTSPLWFFMTIMVTEPLSTPAGRTMQIFYGGFIGLLSQIPFALGPVFNSPELTLLIANALVWPLSLRGRLTLTLKTISDVALNTKEYIFKPSFLVVFKPGQYLEWALPHTYSDGRGSRRYFTIASSPLKQNLRLVVRHSEPGSTYKHALAEMKRGDVIHAAQLAGDFVLPEHLNENKYVFVAGGIGVTPFVSMVEDCLLKKQSLDAHLLYCNNELDDIAYLDIFDRARNIGLATTHVLNKPPEQWPGESGYLTPESVKRLVPDVLERKIYLSGPPGMVGAYETLFRQLGVPKHNIKTDYFPGLA